jgi:hypothetical protein
MITIHLSKAETAGLGNGYTFSEIKLAKKFWNTSQNETKINFPVFKINIGNLTLVDANESAALLNAGGNGRYLLVKLQNIKSNPSAAIAVTNKAIWYENDIHDFVKNDGNNAILNADGTITYGPITTDTQIFGLKKNLINVWKRNGVKTINCFLYQNESSNSFVAFFESKPVNIFTVIINSAINTLIIPIITFFKRVISPGSNPFPPISGGDGDPGPGGSVGVKVPSGR